MGISKKKLKAENKDLNERLGVAESNHLWACDDLVQVVKKKENLKRRGKGLKKALKYNFELLLIYESENIELGALNDISQVFSTLQNEGEFICNIDKIDFSSVFYLVSKLRGILAAEYKAKKSVLDEEKRKGKKLI